MRKDIKWHAQKMILNTYGYSGRLLDGGRGGLVRERPVARAKDIIALGENLVIM